MSNHPKFITKDKDATPISSLRAKIPKISLSDRSSVGRTLVSSLSIESVLLYDWWLAKADSGKGLAVAGFTIREKLGVRDFRSAAIVRRVDTTMLKSKDGILITLSGFINRSRTLQNGFSAEVCSRFRLGFPYVWEKYAEQSDDTGDVTRRKSGCAGLEGSSLPVPLDDLPVSRIRDALMFDSGDSRGCGADEILRLFCRQNSEDTPVSSCSSLEDKSHATAENISINQTPKSNKMSTAASKGESGNKMSPADASKLRKRVVTCRGVTTRSMSRLDDLKRKRKERHPNS